MEQNDTFSKIIHRLFYWNKNNCHVFSRTKFISVLTIIVGFINYLQYFGIIHSFLNGIIISIPVFIFGLLIHKFIKIDSSFYNDNLLDNAKHFLFYWNIGLNKFKLSKTKIITVIITIISLILGQRYDYNHNIVSGAPGGLVFAILVLLIGYAITTSRSDNKNNSTTHYDENNVDNNSGKTDVSADISNVPANLINYLLKSNELKKEFDDKEIKTKKLINAKFDSSLISNNRFMAVLNNCSKIFNEHYNLILNLINFVNDDSIKVEEEINSKINILQSLIDKLDDLSNELVINISKSNTDDVDNVLKDMEDLISTISDY